MNKKYFISIERDGRQYRFIDESRTKICCGGPGPSIIFDNNENPLDVSAERYISSKCEYFRKYGPAEMSLGGTEYYHSPQNKK